MFSLLGSGDVTGSYVKSLNSDNMWHLLFLLYLQSLFNKMRFVWCATFLTNACWLSPVPLLPFTVLEIIPCLCVESRCWFLTAAVAPAQGTALSESLGKAWAREGRTLRSILKLLCSKYSRKEFSLFGNNWFAQRFMMLVHSSLRLN